LFPVQEHTCPGPVVAGQLPVVTGQPPTAGTYYPVFVGPPTAPGHWLPATTGCPAHCRRWSALSTPDIGRPGHFLSPRQGTSCCGPCCVQTFSSCVSSASSSTWRRYRLSLMALYITAPTAGPPFEAAHAAVQGPKLHHVLALFLRLPLNIRMLSSDQRGITNPRELFCLHPNIFSREAHTQLKIP
jgi:hypothetical protein